ncbi:MAG: hypothetical protein ACREKS_22335 [Candidatus Rokuibacteriota bacterium]
MAGSEGTSLAGSLEGWTAEGTGAVGLVEIVEKAFDYRGDVTLVTRDGRRRVGYLFNRNRDVPQPFLHIFPTAGGPAESVLYADIVSIAFTGKDTASGTSYAAWRRRKEAERAGVILPPDRPSASGG